MRRVSSLRCGPRRLNTEGWPFAVIDELVGNPLQLGRVVPPPCFVADRVTI